MRIADTVRRRATVVLAVVAATLVVAAVTTPIWWTLERGETRGRVSYARVGKTRLLVPVQGSTPGLRVHSSLVYARDCADSPRRCQTRRYVRGPWPARHNLWILLGRAAFGAGLLGALGLLVGLVPALARRERASRLLSSATVGLVLLAVALGWLWLGLVLGRAHPPGRGELSIGPGAFLLTMGAALAVAAAWPRRRGMPARPAAPPE